MLIFTYLYSDITGSDSTGYILSRISICLSGRPTESLDTDCSLEWHEIPHHWNDRARAFTQAAGYWKLALQIANLPEHRWVRRILAWNPSV